MEEEVREDLRRVAVFTSGVAEVTRNRAEELVKSWARPDLRREQAQALVRDLMEWSKHNRKELTALVRSEIQSQLSALGVATRRDLDRLERRIAALEESLRGVAAADAPRSSSTRKTTSGRKKTSHKTSSSPGGQV
jgi:polyhydroxyalkanoate synthesis regulator phasin